MTETVSGRDNVDDEAADNHTVDSTPPSDMFDALLEHMRGLQSAFDAKIRYDEVRERLVESMCEELAAHRRGSYQAHLRPVLVDLVGLYDDLGSIGHATESVPVENRLALFRDTVEQILARNGVEKFVVEGTQIDRTRQRVITVVETSDPRADRRVASRLRPGFLWHGSVLRPEWVSAHRYVAEPPPACTPAGEHGTPTVPAQNPPPFSEGVLR